MSYYDFVTTVVIIMTKPNNAKLRIILVFYFDPKRFVRDLPYIGDGVSSHIYFEMHNYNLP